MTRHHLRSCGQIEILIDCATFCHFVAHFCSRFVMLLTGYSQQSKTGSFTINCFIISPYQTVECNSRHVLACTSLISPLCVIFIQQLVNTADVCCRCWMVVTLCWRKILIQRRALGSSPIKAIHFHPSNGVINPAWNWKHHINCCLLVICTKQINSIFIQ